MGGLRTVSAFSFVHFKSIAIVGVILLYTKYKHADTLTANDDLMTRNN